MLKAEALEMVARRAQGGNAIEHHAPRNVGEIELTRPLGEHDARVLVGAAEGEGHAQGGALPLQVVQVEVDHVPPEQQVRVVLRHPGQKRRNHTALIGGGCAACPCFVPGPP